MRAQRLPVAKELVAKVEEVESEIDAVEVSGGDPIGDEAADVLAEAAA